MRSGSIIYLEGVTVSFDGFKALNNLNFFMDYGELRVIIGPNGAGKTTLLDVITGKVKPDEGRVIFGDHTDLKSLPGDRIVNLGIGRKFQTPTLFPNQTVFENLELSLPQAKGVFASLFSSMSAENRQIIYKTLETIGLFDKAQQRSGLLSHGEKQWLEIGMLIVQDPQLLLLDEPVAGMTEQETERTVQLIHSLSERHSILVIDHDMEFVQKIAQKVTVLHEGMVLCEGPMHKIQNDPRVVEVYLGRGNQ